MQIAADCEKDHCLFLQCVQCINLVCFSGMRVNNKGAIVFRAGLLSGKSVTIKESSKRVAWGKCGESILEANIFIYFAEMNENQASTSTIIRIREYI